MTVNVFCNSTALDSKFQNDVKSFETSLHLCSAIIAANGKLTKTENIVSHQVAQIEKFASELIQNVADRAVAASASALLPIARVTSNWIANKNAKRKTVRPTNPVSAAISSSQLCGWDGIYSWFKPGMSSLAPGDRFIVFGPTPKNGVLFITSIVNPQMTCRCQSGKGSSGS